jgi:hypothetical protein
MIFGSHLRSFQIHALRGAVIAACGVIAACSKQPMPEYSIVLENHRFAPDTLTVPANAQFRLHIDNRDDTPDEFDSDALSTEKVVPGKASGAVVIGPLKPGSYPFMGEFHHETAQGKIVAQ